MKHSFTTVKSSLVWCAVMFCHSLHLTLITISDVSFINHDWYLVNSAIFFFCSFTIKPDPSLFIFVALGLRRLGTSCPHPLPLVRVEYLLLKVFFCHWSSRFFIPSCLAYCSLLLILLEQVSQPSYLIRLESLILPCI